MSCSSILLLQLGFVIQKIQLLLYRLYRTVDQVFHFCHNVSCHKILHQVQYISNIRTILIMEGVEIDTHTNAGL